MAEKATRQTDDRTAGKSDNNADGDAKPDRQFELSPSERAKVRDSLPPRAQVLHETIRKQGTVELERNAAALGWSSLAAGLSMGFSALVPAILNVHLAEGPSRFLIATLGYAVGFLIVILARQQLFTENTMTAVLPMMTKPSVSAFRQLLRLWGIVLIGNLLGVAVFALGLLYGRVLEPAVHDALLALAQHILANTPW
ncbi:MAG: formate/nitrite transporter family protein, partial [Dokdonella sp.]